MRLPWCDYPGSNDYERHGIQTLPEEPSIADPGAAGPYRSVKYRVTKAADLTVEQQLEMARIMGDSFARRDPMLRSQQIQRQAPGNLEGYRHADPLGTHEFGSWDTRTIFKWLIRTFFLTDPTSPASSIQPRGDVREQSLAILDAAGRVIGGAINETMTHGETAPLREGDPILDAVLATFAPILAMVDSQEEESIAALEERYPQFRESLRSDKVGHLVLVARSDALPTEDTFELVAGTVERYRDLGFEYIITSAVNQWTGAAASVLGGVAVHFEPFLRRKRLPASSVPIEMISSPTGYLSDKDSGSMLYVIRISPGEGNGIRPHSPSR
jgi:hypothetical protein